MDRRRLRERLEPRRPSVAGGACGRRTGAHSPAASRHRVRHPYRFNVTDRSVLTVVVARDVGAQHNFARANLRKPSGSHRRASRSAVGWRAAPQIASPPRIAAPPYRIVRRGHAGGHARPAFPGITGGEGGIRTPERGQPPLRDFQSRPFNRSGTSPWEPRKPSSLRHRARLAPRRRGLQLPLAAPEQRHLVPVRRRAGHRDVVRTDHEVDVDRARVDPVA
jgi:hypothetical protein